MVMPASNPLSKTKQKRLDHNSPPNYVGKKAKTLCLICEKVVLDSDERTEGRDAVFCEGDCQGWMHQQFVELLVLPLIN